jgi:hypothetical protein
LKSLEEKVKEAEERPNVELNEVKTNLQNLFIGNFFSAEFNHPGNSARDGRIGQGKCRLEGKATFLHTIGQG